jgi:hypothetical protein
MHRRRRGVSTAIGALLFLFVSLSTLAVMGVVMAYEARLSQSAAATSQMVNDRTNELLRAYTLPGGVIEVMNNGSVASETEYLIAVDSGTGGSSLFPFQQTIGPGGCADVTEPPVSTSEGLGVITSLGNTFWASPEPPPGSTASAVVFQETGLPSGTSWFVVVNGLEYTSSSSSMSVVLSYAVPYFYYVPNVTCDATTFVSNSSSPVAFYAYQGEAIDVGFVGPAGSAGLTGFW